MNRKLPLVLLLAAVALLALGRTPLAAFPEPAIVSPSWNLDFTAGKPQPIAIEEIDGSVRWYWFMPYKVVNNTGEDRLFIPEITIATDTGRILPAGENVPASLFDKIKRQLENPLLQSPIEVVGRILQGEDYARESVAVWPAFSEDIDELTVFIGGLSGETQTATHPLTGEPVLMRRTRMLQFSLPGKPANPQNQPVIARGERDVMR